MIFLPFVKLILYLSEILSDMSGLIVFQNFLFLATIFGSTLEKYCRLALQISVTHKLRCFR